MDKDISQSSGCIIKPSATVEPEGGEVVHRKKEEDESKPLISPREDSMSQKPKKSRRKVQWNDNNGNKLVDVFEFQPSDASDSDDEDRDSCLCSIM